jgi:hypothetical protein
MLSPRGRGQHREPDQCLDHGDDGVDHARLELVLLFVRITGV